MKEKSAKKLNSTKAGKNIILNDKEKLREKIDLIKTFSQIFNGNNQALCLFDVKSNSYKCVREQADLMKYSRHLEGLESMAVYPIFENEYTRFATIDFDFRQSMNPKKESKIAAAKFCIELIDIGLYPFLEVSKSGLFHIWIFFSDKVKAKKIRFILTQIGNSLGLKIANGIVEIFPKQDETKGDRELGSCINLPYFKALKTTNITKRRFVNVTNYQPILLVDALNEIKSHMIPPTTIEELYLKLQKNNKSLNLRENNTVQNSKKKQKVIDINSSFLNSDYAGELYNELLNVLSNYWIEGHRQDLCLSLSGYLAKKGFSIRLTKQLIRNIAFNNKEDELNLRLSAVKNSYMQFRSDNQIKGISGLQNILKQEDLKQVNSITNKMLRIIKLKTLTDNDIDNFKLNDEDFIIKDLSIMKSCVTILSGDPGVGKTWLTLHIADTVHRGGKLFDEFDAKISSVVYFDQESPTEVLVNRLRKMNLKPNQKLEILYQNDLSISNDLEIIREKALKADLLIFDSLIQFHSNNEIKPHEMNAILNKFRKIAEDCNVAIILIHQNRKQNDKLEGTSINKLRGTKQITYAVDTAYNLSKSNGNMLILEQVKNRLSEEIEPILYKFKINQNRADFEYWGNIYNLESDLPKKQFLKNVIPVILRKLNKPSSIEDIRNRLVTEDINAGESNIREALRELVDEQFVSVQNLQHNKHLYSPK